MSDKLFSVHKQCDELLDLSALIQAEDDSDNDVIIYKVISDSYLFEESL